jgi:hypothetical protein
VNNNTETASESASVTNSKAGDAVTGLFKVGTVALVMLIATLICFAICGAFDASMKWTSVWCLFTFFVSGMYTAETLNGGNRAKF